MIKDSELIDRDNTSQDSTSNLWEKFNEIETPHTPERWGGLAAGNPHKLHNNFSKRERDSFLPRNFTKTYGENMGRRKGC